MARMRAAVSRPISGLSCSARDTVECETPACLAMSFMEGTSHYPLTPDRLLCTRVQ
jgi:hypothetical protein